MDIFKAARTLRSYPSLLRPFIYRFLPEVHTIQDHVKNARRIIEPEVIARRSARQNAKTDGKRIKATDAVGWMDEVASEKNQPFDIVAAQLLLSVVAIHTTSFTLMALLYDLAANQQYIDELREEIIGVLKEDGGWKKTGLYKMKLLDSCMKESQRLNVLSAGKPMIHISGDHVLTRYSIYVSPRDGVLHSLRRHSHPQGRISPSPHVRHA